MQTPTATSGTTVFLREAGGTAFVPVYHQSSITLKDLTEEFNISSVLECDAQGNVQPRAVAFDSPSDILHSGRHYIARRDARAEMGSCYVTFKGKIFVKEYELEHQTPPAARLGKTVTIATTDANAGVTGETGRRRLAATPFEDKRHKQQALDQHEEYFAEHSMEGSTPRLQQADKEEEEETTISRALALSSERKRPREESTSKSEEVRYTRWRNVDDGSRSSDISNAQCPERTDNVLSFQSSTLKAKGVLLDRTNSSKASPDLAMQAQAAPPSCEPRADETTDLPPSTTAESLHTSTTTVPLQQQFSSLRFIPFTEVAEDGAETYVTLESLQQMCSELSTQETEFQKKHRAATDVLEGARRVLFLNDGSE